MDGRIQFHLLLLLSLPLQLTTVDEGRQPTFDVDRPSVRPSIRPTDRSIEPLKNVNGTPEISKEALVFSSTAFQWFFENSFLWKSVVGLFFLHSLNKCSFWKKNVDFNWWPTRSVCLSFYPSSYSRPIPLYIALSVSLCLSSLSLTFWLVVRSWTTTIHFDRVQVRQFRQITQARQTRPTTGSL